MDLFNILAILITLTAVFRYINHCYIGLPGSVGVMLIALCMSLFMNFMDSFGFSLKHYAEILLGSINFNKALLHGMLSFLLFAGALHININDLLERKWSISALATAGTLISTFLIGTLTWWGLGLFGLIGLEILMLSFTHQYFMLSMLIIPIVVISRFFAVGIPMTLLRSFRTFSPGAVRIMTWGVCGAESPLRLRCLFHLLRNVT